MPVKKKILFSAYFCDPYLKSEAYSGFQWATIISTKYPVVLVTALRYAKDIRKYYNNQLPENLELIGIDDDFPGRKRMHNHQIYLGYFVFMRKLVRMLRTNKELYEETGLVFHRNPCSYRYFTGLHKIDKPLIIGPVSGGIQPPAALKEYFNSEPWSNKLRRFSGIWQKLPVFRNQYHKARKVLISASYVLDVLPMLEESKCKVILETMTSLPEKSASPGDSGQQINVLFVGRLVRYKGPEMILDALTIVDDDRIRIHYAGNGAEMNNLKEKCSRLGLSEKVVFHGFREGDALDELYRKADIFCFPTLKEAAGNVLLEAMAYGLPIISVNYGGPKDILPDAGGIKIEIASYEEMIGSLSQALATLAEDKSLRRRMGEYNRNYCRDHYTWKSLPGQLLPVLEEVMGDR